MNKEIKNNGAEASLVAGGTNLGTSGRNNVSYGTKHTDGSEGVDKLEIQDDDLSEKCANDGDHDVSDSDDNDPDGNDESENENENANDGDHDVSDSDDNDPDGNDESENENENHYDTKPSEVVKVTDGIGPYANDGDHDVSDSDDNDPDGNDESENENENTEPGEEPVPEKRGPLAQDNECEDESRKDPASFPFPEAAISTIDFKTGNTRTATGNKSSFGGNKSKQEVTEEAEPTAATGREKSSEGCGDCNTPITDSNNFCVSCGKNLCQDCCSKWHSQNISQDHMDNLLQG
eukprot:TRINITY_DN878_c0_g2_i5.p1 TRINITY_DN878_c0_g2~~TRINITY_DN878_c0_g2_i5.p1  ORF type:complete len:292 (+),score=102.64 TRINITY_DN878_c0_g2_i5:919-1794(+)